MGHLARMQTLPYLPTYLIFGGAYYRNFTVSSLCHCLSIQLHKWVPREEHLTNVPGHYMLSTEARDMCQH